MASVAALALVIALWALIEGIVAIVHAFELRAVIEHWWVLLLTGVVSVLFGVAAIYYYPGLSLAFAVAWVAWWLLTAGAIGAYAAVMERKVGLSWIPSRGRQSARAKCDESCQCSSGTWEVLSGAPLPTDHCPLLH